jgi:hypothetical protein
VFLSDTRNCVAGKSPPKEATLLLAGDGNLENPDVSMLNLSSVKGFTQRKNESLALNKLLTY